MGTRAGFRQSEQPGDPQVGETLAGSLERKEAGAPGAPWKMGRVAGVRLSWTVGQKPNNAGTCRWCLQVWVHSECRGSHWDVLRRDIVHSNLYLERISLDFIWRVDWREEEEEAGRLKGYLTRTSVR